jgi:hypothetical protein
MAALDPRQVLEDLKRLRAGRATIFGADHHHFVVNAPLPESEVARFEAKHRITLPLKYRARIGRSDDSGIALLTDKDGSQVKFGSWYRE